MPNTHKQGDIVFDFQILLLQAMLMQSQKISNTPEVVSRRVHQNWYKKI